MVVEKRLGGDVTESDSTISTTIISGEQFRVRSSTLGEVLSALAGVETRSYGGPGSFTTVSIRGSETDHVTVMLDGVPLNEISGGTVDLSALSLKDVDRIEVYRSNSPVRFPGSPIGGAVNIITKASRKRHTEITATAGSFTTLGMSMSSSFPLNKHSIRFGYEHLQSDGDFKYANHNGTPLDTADDKTDARVNNDFTSDSLTSRADFNLAAGRTLTIINSAFNKEQGIPGTENLLDINARLETLRNVFSATFTDDGLSIPGVISTYRASSAYQRTKFFNPDTSYFGIRNNRFITRADSLRATYEHLTGDTHDITLALGFTRENMSAYDSALYSRYPDPSHRTTTAIAIEDSLSLLHNRLTVAPSWRHETRRSHISRASNIDLLPGEAEKDTATNSALHLGARLKVTASLSLRTSMGDYFRAPTFTDLFGDNGAVVGNPSLVAETGHNEDAGITWSRRLGRSSLLLDASVFRNQSDNTIVYVHNSAVYSRPYNIGRSITKGAETSLSLKHGRFALSTNFTYQRAIDDSSTIYRGNPLPGRHERAFSATVTYSPGRWKFTQEFSLTGGCSLSSTYNPAYYIGKSEVFTSSVSYMIGRATITLEGKNLTGEQVADILNYPLPGRSFYMTYRREL